MRIFFLPSLLLSIVLFSCKSSRTLAPTAPFDQVAKAAEPDYSQLEAWCAHPDKEDEADKHPPGAQKENQAAAQADVFFVHPTTFYKSMNWNADSKDSVLNAKTDGRAVMHQASVFNRSCRVFAPRYRQMVYGGFFTADTISKIKALELAYQDVRKAFQYYLDTYNAGRPIVIAGHSQGAFHAQRLLREFFDGQALQKQLVAAYVPGWPFQAKDFNNLPICNSPEQNGCVMGWYSWRSNSKPEGLNTYYKNAVVVNPINWKTDNSLAPKAMHQGYLNGKYSKIKSQAVYSQIYQGILWVKSPLPLAPIKNFHVGDFNLFWMDIRKNVALRVQYHLKQKPSKP